MKKIILNISLVLLFIVLTGAYYSISFGAESIDKIFLTLSTFLFALFTGFFISRQAGRYKDIRKLTADFDGMMSATFRASGHFGEEAQQGVGEIIKKHYKAILENEWDYAFTHKTTTLTDLNRVLHETLDKEGADGIKGSAITRIMLGLHSAQVTRKNMVALRDERIPRFQWVLIYL